ncbi:hypothetical protein LOTGIDRAFT_115731 [Lottia gigantea]|uniref:Crossover junction endonuclease MUS81 n=1 Tax=Lottia gigantea TaxID=225164 RepID=V4C4L0_LOTGI|nr:hypothetical protein LOTGIDRAFT_115731 [Lottia gigantea]ESO96484.1 hypothetical protein LOTGIDRAFT_115731 [Lottia gigantea]
MEDDLDELYGKRKRKKVARPNPLFEKWLTEWRDEAALKGWKSQYNYAKALDALKKFPLRLEYGKDCKMLKNFGEKTCKMLDMKLAEHMKVNGDTLICLEQKDVNFNTIVLSDTYHIVIILSKIVFQKRRKSSGNKEYIPAYRSGGYAILLALYTDRQAANCKGYLTKTELMREAQPLADKSFTEPDPGAAQWYTAWSSMATLLKKGLVVKERSPAQFSLSESGCALAYRLLYVDEHTTFNDTPVAVRQDQVEPPLPGLEIDDNKEVENDEGISDFGHMPTEIDDNRDNSQSSSTTVTSLDVDTNSQSSTVSSTSSLPVPEFVLRPGEFEVVLVIDNREFYGSSKSKTKILLPDLMKNKVNCDLRELHVGDLVWIAREKVPHIPGQLRQGEGRELVLDYIVERKRMDDLVGSMVDGRLQDQKFRLKRCGVKNAIFLIENYGSMQNFSIGEDRIKQSIANTQVIDGFGVKRVKDTKESVVYLTVMTRYLQNYYQNKTLHTCSPDVVKELNRPFDINNTDHYLMPFQNFNLGSVKSKALTVSEMFGKQLIQLNGMSADKAKAVIDNYPTPISLLEAYAGCRGLKEKEQLLAGIKCGKLTRNLGLAQSKQIAGIYCTTGALT